jgi:hypothetical protein
MKRLAAAPSLLLFLAALMAYLANGRTIGAGDTLPAAYLPWSLLRQANFDLDEFPILHDKTAVQIFPLLDGIPYYLLYRNGHYLSAYSPGPGVLALPVYLLPIVLGVKADSMWAARLEKFSGAIITALSVVFLYWALRGVTSQGWACVIALVYALGTSSLSMSSQGLWQHGPSQFFLSLGLCFLVKGLSDDRYLGYAGFPMAAAVVMRSTDLLLVLPVTAWIVYAHRARARSLALWALPPAAALAAYHIVYFVGADRGPGHTTAPAWALFSQIPLSEGVPGLLVSPSRGLFVYSPVLLFSLAGMIAVWRGGPALWRALSLGPPLVVLLVGKWITWWGGHSWGPRLLGDIAPILCFFLFPVVPYLDRRRFAKAVFLALAFWSVGAHALGAWLYDGRWDALATEESYARLWPWTGSPLAFYGREALVRLGLAGPWLGPRPSVGSSPGSLAASYEVGPVPAEVMSGERFSVSLSAVNTGKDVWPVTMPGDRGAVRLGWRWYLGDQEVAAGRELPPSNVPPGRSAHFRARIIAPVHPGDYTLVLDLVSELVTWFGERGAKAVRFPVRVFPLDVTRMLTEPIRAVRPAPVVTIATDHPAYRRDGTLDLRVSLEYPHHPRNFDAYVILEQPGGPPLFFDGHAMPRPAGAAWPAWVRSLPLPARANGRFELSLSALAPGAYRWHVALTEPGGYHALARAETPFRIEP